MTERRPCQERPCHMDFALMILCIANIVKVAELSSENKSGWNFCFKLKWLVITAVYLIQF